MSDTDTKQRLEKEIENFTRVLENGGVASSIPSIFTYWAGAYLSPRFVEVFGDPRISFIFASELFGAYKGIASERDIAAKPFRIVSLGSGDCSTEIEIVKFLIGFGCVIEFLCTDLNPVVSKAASERASREGVAQYMTFRVINLNDEFPEGTFDAVVANHSLHHFIELEYIFDSVKRSLHDDGVFVISDMIGRNGHMRWPEALVFVEQLWKFLPLEKKFNIFAKCYEQEYVNYDCTLDDTFEGIRAQDILRLLLDRFHFAKFVGHGGVIDIFIDRIYGNNFSPDNDADKKFIDYVEALNTSLIDSKVITPTAMFATLSKQSGDCRYSKWSPQSSLRPLTAETESDRESVSVLESEIEALRKSTSWRITAPLRALATLVRR